jgi:hypothetical protein
MLEDERLRVLTVERLVLETICFKFEVDTALGIVIKISKALERERNSCYVGPADVHSRQGNVPSRLESRGGFVRFFSCP